MKKNVTKIYITLVVIAAGYILFSMFSNKKVLGRNMQHETRAD